MEIIGLGETMVVFDPDQTVKLRAVETFHKYAGGCETNTLIGLQRLGFSTRWISAVGDDEFGRFLITKVRGEGVDTSFIKIDPKHQTGIFFVERSITEDCRSIYYRDNSAYRNFSQEDINESMFLGTKIFYFSGITPSLNELCLDMLLKSIEIAKKLKIKIVMDPNLRLKLISIERAREVLIPIMKNCNIVLPNESEIELLFPGREIDDIAEELISAGVEILVVKMGIEGAVAYTKDGKYKTKAFLLEKILSSMGAGDAFNAGFLSGILENIDIVDCLKRGAAAGTFGTMSLDSYQMAPSMEELNSFVCGKRNESVR